MRILLSLFCSLILTYGSGQIELSMLQSDINTIADIYQIQVNNPSGEPIHIIVDVELLKNNQSIYKAKSSHVQMFSPLKAFNQNMLEPLQIERKLTTPLEGEMEVIYRLIDKNSGTIVFMEQFSVSATTATTFISPQSKPSSTNSWQKVLDFQYSGRADIYGQVSNGQTLGTQVPQNYVRAAIHPDFQLSGIPVGLDIFLSTEQNAFHQSMNQVSLRFDAATFKRLMVQKLQNKVKEIEAIGSLDQLQNLNQLREKVMAKKFPKLAEWEAKLQNPEIQEGLAQLKQLKTLEQVINSQDVQKAIARKIKLEAQDKLNQETAEELERLNAFVQEIDKLKSKAESIKLVATQYEEFKDLKQKVAKAKKYVKKDIIKDSEFLKKGLKSLNLLNKPQEILNGFNGVTVGTSYPYFSKQTLSGLSVNGINIEWNPGKIYIATAYGKSARMTLNDNYIDKPLTLSQNTFAIKAGYGSSQNSHLHLTYINIDDKFNQQYINHKSKPQNNRIIGVSSKLALLNNRINFGGEINTSVLTRDKTIQTKEIQEFDKSDIPMYNLFGELNNSSSFGLAWRAFSDVRLLESGTKLKAYIERIGPNYHSLGAPIQLNNTLTWKTELRQSFFKKKINISAFARQDANNLNLITISTITSTKQYGISTSFQATKWPSLRIQYAPYAQSSMEINSKKDYSTNVRLLNVVLNYPYNIGQSITSFSQFSFTHQKQSSNLPNLIYQYYNYSFSQTINYKNNNLQFDLSFTPNQFIENRNQKVLNLNIIGSFMLLEKLNSSFGFQHLAIIKHESRTGYYLIFNYPISKKIGIEARIQKNIYNPIAVENKANDAFAWMRIKLSW